MRWVSHIAVFREVGQTPVPPALKFILLHYYTRTSLIFCLFVCILPTIFLLSPVPGCILALILHPAGRKPGPAKNKIAN
jgi:hypothetical protein